VLLADGMVSFRVVEKSGRRALCAVEQPGTVRSGQGVNLPGVKLSLPSVTDKDGADLEWMIAHELDFVGLSFVRTADDVRELRRRMDGIEPQRAPLIVAKIEKREAVDQLEEILGETDAVMVARGDLGVDVDVAEVPLIQKRIIRACNRRQVPVITATQMLDSMERNRLPTRAEASDVANAVLDGTDAVMLSGETAIGEHPLDSVRVMHRIVREAEGMVIPGKGAVFEASSRNIATQMTRAVAHSALHAAEELEASLIVVLTRSGRTAVAVSALRNKMPILAITGTRHTARRLSMVWGVSALATERFDAPPRELLDLVAGWGREQGLLKAGDRIVLVGTTDWTQPGKNLMVVQTIA
jgi:pyruvate kinase